MRRVLSYAALLGVPLLLLIGPLLGADKTPADKMADKELDKTSAKMVQAGQVVGKVMNVYEDKKKLRVQITYNNLKLNQGAVTGLAQAQAAYAQAQARRDVNGMRSAMQQMAQHQANLYQMEKKTQDMEIQAADDVVVRNAKPPEEFDEKGKLKKHTAKELKELRGPDPKLPGYKAEFGDIQAEMVVKLQLVRKKDAPKPVRKPKDKEADLDVTSEYEPQASLIIIVYNPATVAPPAPGK